MPFTFARYLDPMIQAPIVQNTIVAAMMTLGFVDRTRDASDGAMWRVMQKWGWITWSKPKKDVIFIRRYLLCHDPKGRNPLGHLAIGVELNDKHYRITCEGLTPAEQDRTTRLLDFVKLSLGECKLGSKVKFRAHAIHLSSWAATPVQDASGTAPAPARPQGDVLQFHDNLASARGADIPVIFDYRDPPPFDYRDVPARG